MQTYLDEFTFRFNPEHLGFRQEATLRQSKRCVVCGARVYYAATVTPRALGSGGREFAGSHLAGQLAMDWVKDPAPRGARLDFSGAVRAYALVGEFQTAS